MAKSERKDELLLDLKEVAHEMPNIHLISLSDASTSTIICP
jgi:hypothetical protein